MFFPCPDALPDHEHLSGRLVTVIWEQQSTSILQALLETWSIDIEHPVTA